MQMAAGFNRRNGAASISHQRDRTSATAGAAGAPWRGIATAVQAVGRVITGRQVREPRTLLGILRAKFAEKLGVPHTVEKLAEMTDGNSTITIDRARQIRRALERIGVEICAGVDGAPGVRLRKVESQQQPDTVREGATV